MKNAPDFHRLDKTVITRGAQRHYACPQAISRAEEFGRSAISARTKSPECKDAQTYAQLLNAFCVTLPASKELGKKSPQERNARACIAAWIRFQALTLDTPVGEEFTRDYSTKLGAFESSEFERGIKRTTMRDRRSMLGRLRKMYVQRQTSDLPASFARALDELLARCSMTAKQLETKTGIPAYLFGLWRREKATPSARRSDLPDLERALGAAPGTLISRLPRSQAPVSERNPAPATTNYRKRMQRLVTLPPYRLTHYEDAFRSEWQALLQYKTAELPELKRQPRGRWRPKSESLVRYQKPEWSYALPDGRRIPSAYKAFINFTHFLGWLLLPTDQGGRGLDANDAQTIAWISRPDLVLGFLRWLSARSGGVNSHTLGFIDTVNALIHPTTGYLTQQPRFCQQLPTSHRPSGDWAEHCASAFRTLKEARRVYQSSAVHTRDPEEPIAPLLALRNPIKPLLEMLHVMERAMPPRTAPLRRAEHRRDILLVAMLLSNPLRITHFIFMRYCPGRATNLYKARDGVWHIRFPYEAFKNGDSLSTRKSGGARTSSAYDVEVGQFVYPYLDRYLGEARPALLQGGESPLLFVGQNGNPSKPVEYLDARLQHITAKFLPDCAGFRAHAFRHLVATAWLKAHPRDYVRVAHMLDDSLETVLRVYGHLEAGETLGDWDQWLRDVDDRNDGTP